MEQKKHLGSSSKGVNCLVCAEAIMAQQENAVQNSGL